MASFVEDPIYNMLVKARKGVLEGALETTANAAGVIVQYGVDEHKELTGKIKDETVKVLAELDHRIEARIFEVTTNNAWEAYYADTNTEGR